jgi:excisionase family DNA binding protein
LDGETDRLLLRIPEAAARLGLGRTTVYALIGSGDIPTVRVGRAIRIPASALGDWVARHTETDGRAVSV